MSDTLEYKGYTGSMEFSEEDNIFFGKVIGIRSLISYEGNDIASLIDDFHKAVDDYLAILDSLYGSLPNDITEEEAREERLDALDPFYDPANIARIEKSVQELSKGKGTSHDLIKD